MLKYITNGSHCLFLAVIPIALLLFGGVLDAGELSGVVIDEGNGAPVAGAVVEIQESRQKVSSSSDGSFLISNIQPGYYTIAVSRLGYYQNQISFEITENEGAELAVYLMSRPIEISPVVVTTRHTHTKFDELSELSHTLSGKELQKELGQTLASTLKNETGLAMRSMGPAPARPVIRGLGGDRVTISEDGGKTTDLSATSPDHAVTIEPFSIERIEVIRGPQVLKYSSTTIGGVVNVIRHEIPQDARNDIFGSIGAYAESANSGYLNSASLTIPVNRMMLRGEINRKESSDLNTPQGKLGNSYSENLDYGIGGAYAGSRGFIGASFRYFDLEYGVPGGFVGAHPNGVDIDMKKRRYNLKARLDFSESFLENIETHFTRAYYRHKEFEASGAIGTEFKIVNYLGYTNINHRALGQFDTGTFGIAYEHRDLDLGGLIFSPPSRSLNVSPYLIESFKLGKLNFETGIRYNFSAIEPDHDNPDSRIGYIRERKFNSVSASLSILYELDRYWSIGGNISRSTRTPTIEELFSEGPHLAAYSFETGNPDLSLEKGVGGEVFIYQNSDKLYFMLNTFYNDLDNYIIHRNTGEINWTTVLPVYAATGVRARLYGIESELKYGITDRIDFVGSVSYTIGEFKTSGNPLPQIPPLKGQVELKYSAVKLTSGINCRYAAKQTRVDEFEEPTAGYALLNLYSQYTLPTTRYIHTISVNLDNVFDTEYRNHLSRVKSILPEAGRNFRLTYKMFFDL